MAGSNNALKLKAAHIHQKRQQIQDYENIIENLRLRSDLGIVPTDPVVGNTTVKQMAMTFFTQHPIRFQQLQQKTQALIQNTVLENYELGRMQKELKEENDVLQQLFMVQKNELAALTVQEHRLVRYLANYQHIMNSKTGVSTADKDMNENDAFRQTFASCAEEMRQQNDTNDSDEYSGTEALSQRMRNDWAVLQLQATIEEKQNTIDNLFFRFRLDECEHAPTHRQHSWDAWQETQASAHRECLENFERRELINDGRDNNFHLRNELYDLDDKISDVKPKVVKLIKEWDKRTQFTLQDIEAYISELLQPIHHRYNTLVNGYCRNIAKLYNIHFPFYVCNYCTVYSFYGVE